VRTLSAHENWRSAARQSARNPHGISLKVARIRVRAVVNPPIVLTRYVSIALMARGLKPHKRSLPHPCRQRAVRRPQDRETKIF
jgi:hypothetical protein